MAAADWHYKEVQHAPSDAPSAALVFHPDLVTLPGLEACSQIQPPDLQQYASEMRRTQEEKT